VDIKELESNTTNLSWQQIPSTLVSEILCHGFDGVVLDAEHGCYNNETLYACIQVIKNKQKKCFVRLTEVSKTQIRYCLDAGADGLIFSTVETEEQCKKIIEYSCFSPRGSRGLGLVRQNFWGEEGLIPDQEPILICQIESAKAIENLATISSYNFDYYLIGPYDLSLSLGIPGEFDNGAFKLKLKEFSDIIPEGKRAVHIPDNVKQNIKKYAGYGLKCLGMDTIGLLNFHKGIINA
jgi:2-keto-3-deoxy-L-rhamnonate aldolase RhmA